MHASSVKKDANTANTYEVQGFTAGEWRVLHVCATSAEAMNEVAVARDSSTYLGIRVTVETYDQIARKYFSRVAYHYSPLTEVPSPVVATPATPVVRIDTRPARTTRAGSTDFIAHKSLDWMIATRLAVMLGAAVVAVMALGFY